MNAQAHGAGAERAYGSQDAPAPRLHTVEGVRAVAALAVTWFHMTNTWRMGPARASGQYGWLGVEAFFVISGFVIPYSLHQAGYRLGDFWRFLARRTTRLEPPYLASIALVIVLGVLSAHAPAFRGTPLHLDWPQVAFHLFYAIPISRYDWLNVVYWTLAYEFVFYLLSGLLTPLLLHRPILLTVLVFAVVTVGLKTVTGHWDVLPLLFFSGVAVCRLKIGRDPPWVLITSLCAAAAIQVMMGAPLQAGVGLTSALVIAFVKIPANPILSVLAAMSYAMYLTHVPIGGRVVNLGRRYGEGPVHDLLVSLLGLSVAMAFAYLFYRLIDVPATQLSRRIVLGRPISVQVQ